MIGFGKTDTGLVRSNNEDSIFVTNVPIGVLPNLYIVSDGMGGHKGGEVASSRSINFFCDALRHMKPSKKQVDHLDVLVTCLASANKSVYEVSMHDDAVKGMGATFSACVAAPGKVYAAHVGDSRIYLIHNGGIRQLSCDHTYVHEMVKAGEITKEQARTHPNRNVITRAVGTEAEVNADGIVADVCEGDYILMCSDGLSNMVSDEQMLLVVQETSDVPEKCEKLIELAKQNGGDDNISVVLVLINEVRA